MFLEIKEKVKHIIKNSNEITNKTNYNCSGIYMIYIDNFDDNKIIPFYIGQTNNFQKRYKQHLTEIMALNRYEYDIYKTMFLDLYYDGRLKSCKIFKYMIEHHCTLKDFHMVILEEVENNNLDKKEQEFFKEYYPAFLGFNQFNSISLFQKKLSVKEYLQYAYEDSVNIKNFYDYGYTKDNYLIGFFKRPLSEESLGIIKIYNSNYISENYLTRKSLTEELLENKDLIEKTNKNILELFQKSNLDKFNKYNALIPKLETIKQTLKTDIQDRKIKIEKSCQKEIKDYFAKNDLNIHLKYSNVLSCIIDDSQIHYNSFAKYLKNKKIHDNIVDILNKKKSVSKKKLRASQQRLYKINRLLKKLYNIERLSAFKNLIPKIKYKQYPLQDRFEKNTFNPNNKISNNICYINIEYTNNGKSKYFEVEPIKIDYFIQINDNIFQKNDIFLHSQLDRFFEQDIHCYIEKDYNNVFKLYQEKFSIYLATKENKDKIITNYISTHIEFYTGINEFTLKDKSKTTLNDILKEISTLINKDTKIVYTTSAYKRLILRDKHYLENLENNLKDKLLKTIKA